VDTTVTPWTDYDADADIFYLRLCPNEQDATTQEVDHGVHLDRNPTTREVIGIEVLDFLGHFAMLKDLSWLSPLGIPAEALALLKQQIHECQQTPVRDLSFHSK
jgi:uncharacterized protein YuzE